MKTPYTYALLRYYHDPVTGEFANVGVVLYAPKANFLRSLVLPRYSRLSCFFGRDIEGGHFRALVRHIGRSVDAIGDRLGKELDFEGKRDLREIVNGVLLPDDSAFQFSEVRGGLATVPEKALDDLFERFVTRYVDRGDERPSRTDEDVWRVYRHALAEQDGVLERLRPRTLRSTNYEHEFPRAWTNGVLNVAESVSMDLVEPRSVREKAASWVGRIVSLEPERLEPFTLWLLLGRPSNPDLESAYTDARHILEQMPTEHHLVEESDADRFAESVARDLDHAAS